MLCNREIVLWCSRRHHGQWNRQTARPTGRKHMEFQPIIPLLTRRIVAFSTQFTSDFCVPGLGAFCKNHRTGIHDIFHRFMNSCPNDIQPMFRQNLKSRRQSVQPIRKCLIAGQLKLYPKECTQS